MPQLLKRNNFIDRPDEDSQEAIGEVKDMFLGSLEEKEDPRKLSFRPTVKQELAFDAIFNPEIEEVVFGGGAGGAKTYLGCATIILMAQKYTGIRLLIGRESYTDLVGSTLVTFFDVCKDWGLLPDRDYVYNQQKATITFVKTGSVVNLKELRYYPKDPNFDRLGSFEYTFVFLDEAQQIRGKAIEVLSTRIRYKVSENGLTPTMLMTCNPTKGYLYTEFYKPWKDGTLKAHRLFIQALASDNKYIDPTYIDKLKRRDKATQERLLYGNWEYDDDPTVMVDYDAILDLFSNKVAVMPKFTDEKFKRTDMYIITDVARFGKDRIVIFVFYKYQVVAIYTISHGMDTKELATELEKLEKEWRVPRSHTLVDGGGVGGGVVDNLYGCVEFTSGSSAYDPGYDNLKTECAYKFAEFANAREIGITCDDVEIRDLIIEEIEVLKTRDADKDTNKLKIIDKPKMKDLLGRSPDFLDTLIMRMWYEVRFKVELD